jgi:hypothetical protein
MIGDKKKILQTRFNHIKLLAGTPAMSRAGAATTTTTSTTPEEGVKNK